ncbi:hypothetical protein ACQPX6_00275 [Actinomycetospora sp. CA-101289]
MDEGGNSGRTWKKWRKRIAAGAVLLLTAAPDWWPIIEPFLS